MDSNALLSSNNQESSADQPGMGSSQTLNRNSQENNRTRSTNNQRLRHQRKLRAAIRAQENRNSTPSFPKYFLIKFLGKELDTRIDVLGVDNDLKVKIGKPDEIKKHNRDTLMVKVKSRSQGESLRVVK